MAQASGKQTVGVVLLVVVMALLLWVGGNLGPGPSGPNGTSDPGAGQTARLTESAPPGSTGVDPESGLPWVPLDDLPPEAISTLALIDAGGPFPYDRDGVVFENREQLLPEHPSGYYHEYTVDTPGSDDRGARRIVTGAAGEYYWTQDHYQSFGRIAR